MQFMHNGDPFKGNQLYTLQAQYSSKAEENDIEKDTTGKYGTGFMTSYILSLKIKVNGIFQFEKGKNNQTYYQKF